MKFYDKYFKNNYEELITFYPRFYREVYEMVEILKANGRIADMLEADIEQTYLNNFIDYADEATITKLEKFLMIGLNKSRTLEERRRLVKCYFVGFGKVSAAMLEEMIASYTNADVAVKFEPSDDKGNNTLYIDFERGKEPTLYMSDIILLLGKKIPAHINWQASVVYRFPTGIGVRRTHYKFGYDLCGTKPEIAMLGAIVSRASVTQALHTSAAATYSSAAEDELLGLKPDISTIGELFNRATAAEAREKSYLKDYSQSSETRKQPEGTTVGDFNEINTGAAARASSYSVDYNYCGTRYSQS